SACVFALLGAVEREVAPGAALGIHSPSSWKGGVLESGSIRVTGNEIRQCLSQVARYATEMGIDRGLVTLTSLVPIERVRFLSRDEIVDFAIDTREVAESRWDREEDRSGRVGVVKCIVR